MADRGRLTFAHLHFGVYQAAGRLFAIIALGRP
jgi:hypothetical protein